MPISFRDHTWPKQSPLLDRRVKVMTDHDASVVRYGHIVRADAEPPRHLIILLDDDTFILSSECQYTVIPKSKED